MGLNPTTRSQEIWQIDGGEDFLQGRTPDGTTKFWIDANGKLNPHGSIGVPNSMVTQDIYVDGGATVWRKWFGN